MSTEAHSPRGSPIAPDVGLDRSGPDEHADTVRAVRIILAARPWVADAIAVLEAEDPRPSISFNSPGDGSSGDEQAEIDEINRAAAAWAEAERFLYGPGTQAEDDMIDALRELISCVSSPPEDAGDMHILDTVEAVFALQPDLGRRIQAPHPVVPDVPLQGNGAENTTSMAGATEHGGDENNVMDLKKANAQIFQITISLRDDWLHRGDALQDMDLQTYAEYVEREAKPIRGADMRKALARPTFAFVAHYKLAQGFMQVLRPGHRRHLARFNVPNCMRENVNEGEENAQFKAFHCSLLRCPGVGMCADPLLCAPALWPNSRGVYRFRRAWRAREKEILVLAMRGQKKKMKARRFETLHDTTLCKVLHSTCDPNPASRMLQVDLQRWFRQFIRYLREGAPAESPSNYGYPERMVQKILCFVGEGGAAEHASGRQLWHDDQLHLAEWQAMQQIEFLFNLTLTVDAKNIALEKLKAHKKGTSVHAEAADFSEPMNKLRSADDEEMQAVADYEPIFDEAFDEEKARGVVLQVTDKAVIMRMLTREEEIAQARLPGQGRREDLQCMREAADAYGTPEHTSTNATDPSMCGAAEHEKKPSVGNSSNASPRAAR